MTRPRFEARIFRSGGGHLNHEANEAVVGITKTYRLLSSLKEIITKKKKKKTDVHRNTRVQICSSLEWLDPITPGLNRLVGLVVKASSSRAEDPGFQSRLRRGDFSGSSHTSDFEIGTPVATLPGVWR